MTATLGELARGALSELAQVFDRLPDSAADDLIAAVASAKRIVVFGCGREGLQIRGFAMRLFHMGRDVSVWGDMTMPAVGLPGRCMLAKARRRPGRRRPRTCRDAAAIAQAATRNSTKVAAAATTKPAASFLSTALATVSL